MVGLWPILTMQPFLFPNHYINFHRLKTDKMNALEVIGVLGLIYFGFRITLQACKCSYRYLIKAPQQRDCIRKHKGKWAVITGATDGIGKAYANALAKKGLNVVLISRSQKKLNECASEITQTHSVDTKVIAIDFSQDSDIYKTIQDGLENLEIGVLVNNVGISSEFPDLFLSTENKEDLYPAMIRVNVMAAVKMCEIVLPRMVDQRAGVIINISSLTAKIIAPYLTVYGATKAFVEKFSDDLRVEYEDKGVVIQTVYPGAVVTKMTKLRKSTFLAPTADEFVASALSKTGMIDSTTGYFSHSLMLAVLNFIKYLCLPLAIKLTKSQMESVKVKALKHKAKVQES